MDEDRDGPDEWIARAVAQTVALRETVRHHPDLRELVDVILLDLGSMADRRSNAPDIET